MDDLQGFDNKELKRLALAQARARRKTVVIAVLIVFAVLFMAVAVINFMMNSYKKQIGELSAVVERYEAEAAVYEEASKEVSLAVLESSIQEAGKLITAEYLYTNVGQYENVKQVFGVDVGLTRKSFVVKWDGVITAGVDLSEASISANEANKTLTVILPSAKIIAHDPDNSSFQTIDEKSGLFNPISVNDVREFDLESETAMIERAKAGELLEKAEKNAEAMIARMILTNPAIKDEYTVKVEFAESN